MERGAIGLAFSLSSEPRSVELSGVLLLGSAGGVRSDTGTVELPANSVALLELTA
jgi:hypothetical protein